MKLHLQVFFVACLLFGISMLLLWEDKKSDMCAAEASAHESPYEDFEAWYTEELIHTRDPATGCIPDGRWSERRRFQYKTNLHRPGLQTSFDQTIKTKLPK